jgi:hypothetical protein
VTGSPAVIRTLRLGLLGLATLSVVAIGFELVAERHWANAVQFVPWVMLGVLLVAIGLAATTRRRPVLVARVLCGVALAASVFGIYEHVADNYMVGELDAAYTDTWTTLPFVEKVFLAVTKTVGASPPIAPGAVGQSALLVLLATVARERRPEAA